MLKKLFVAKAIGYRIFSILITFIVTYLFTRDLPTTTGITVVVAILGTVGYYFYDLVFDKLGYITAKTKEIEGIKGGYPLIHLSEKLKGLVALMRPLTIFIPAIATVMGILICLGYYNQLYLFWDKIGIVILASLVIAFTQGLGQIINQITDIEIDKISKGYRPLPSGRITKKEASIFAFILSLFVISGGFFINYLFGSMVLVLFFFSVFYSVEPIRAKRRGWGSPVWQATSRGLLSLPVIWAVFGNPFATLTPWVISSLLFLFLIGAANIKDIGDKEADLSGGIVTLPVRYGNKLGYYISPFLIAPFFLLPIYVSLGLLPFQSIYLMVLSLLSIVMGYNLIKQKRVTIKFIENDLNWLGMYSMIGLLYIGFAVIYLS